MSNTGALEHALLLAEQGFHLFPLRKGSKLPQIENFTQRASRDPADLKAWRRKHPGCNFGIATSKFGDNEALLVIDVDSPGHGEGKKNGHATLLARELSGDEFPPTLEQITPTNGRHMIYRVPAAVRQGVDVLGPGLDVRGNGGYIVAPGSVVGAGSYAVDNACPPSLAPQWLIDACGSPRTRESTREPMPGVDPDRACARVIEYLTTAERSVKGTGGDQCAYRVAAKCLALGATPEQALDLMLSEAWDFGCGWAPDRLQEKIANAAKYMVDRPGAEAPEAVFEPVAAPERASRYKLQTVDDLLSAPTPSWLVRGVLPKQGMGVIYGRPGCGKTFLVLDIAMAIARGEPWAGARVTRGDVLYIGLEGQVRTRIEAYREHHGGDLSRLRTLTGAGLNMLESRDAKDLVEAIRTAGVVPSLIVIDTLNRAIPGGDENNSKDMGTAIERAAFLSRTFGCMTLFVHHSGKDPANGARGHSSLLGATDAELMVTSDAAGNRRMRITKAKDAEDGREYTFALTTVDLGPDPDEPMDRITSCVVTDLQAAEAQYGGRDLKWTPDRKLVFDAFNAASSGTCFGAPIQCTTAQWRAAFYEQNPLGSDVDGQETKARENRKKKFDRGKDWLIAERIVRQIGSQDLFGAAAASSISDSY